MTSKYLSKSANAHQIQSLFGNALEIIPTLDLELDLVFIDADKKNNTNYFQMVLPKLRKGGFVLVDNVLWSGKVIEEKPDKDTLAIMAFNKRIRTDSRLHCVLLPVRDGIMVSQKI